MDNSTNCAHCNQPTEEIFFVTPAHSTDSFGFYLLCAENYIEAGGMED